MNLTVFISVLFILQLVCFMAGRRASQNLKNQEDYFLAGKGVRFLPLLMTFIATQVGGGLVLGSAEEAYRYGWAVLLYPLGACLGFLLLAVGIGKRLAQFQVSTVAQLFEVVYGSVRLKKIASLLSILSLFMILAAQVIASQKFMFSLGINQNFLFLAFWAVVILYTVVGGFKAVISIDIIQAAFFVCVFLLGFGYVLYTNEYSAVQVFQSGWSSEHFDFDASKLSGWLLMPLLFMVIEQDMAQRCFAAKSPRVVAKASLWAAIGTMFICVIPIFFGVLGKTLKIQPIAGSSIFMAVTETVANPILAALIGCAVLMAIISTAISLLNAVSSNLTQDFDLSFLSAKEIRQSRWVTAVVGVAGVAFSYFFDNVVELLIQSYELSIVSLFVPVFAALFKRSGYAFSATLAIVCGTIGFFLFRFILIAFPKEILSLLLSVIGYGVGELIMQSQTARRSISA